MRSGLLPIEGLNIRIVVGPFYKHLNFLRKITAGKKNIQIKKDPKHIWKEFSWSDIAISNAGNTLFELACLGIPTICVPAFPHENLYAQEFTRTNFVINMGYRTKLKKENFTNSLREILENVTLRKKMCRAGKKIVDGRGLIRMTNIISKS